MLQQCTYIGDVYFKIVFSTWKKTCYWMFDPFMMDNYFQTKDRSGIVNQKNSASFINSRLNSKSKEFKRLDRQGPEYFFISSMYGDISDLLLQYEYQVKLDFVHSFFVNEKENFL